MNFFIWWKIVFGPVAIDPIQLLEQPHILGVPPTKFCDTSLVCIDKFDDGVPTQNRNPKVVCLNGASEVVTTTGFLSRSVERVCSSNSVGEMCVANPDPCKSNYCLDPWGFAYPAEKE
tara:strand:+ start:1266 stop:1619 length:354 start_codon:yes stop_codon:yes gene_type:complete